ncbi:response regulator [Roseomonas elaeocarpi]|uniref:Response regulator n=1 Tax=Roseomonas elaeocarpi TaxID=907779 RepID=A0ABV6JN93_9PROT
MSAEALVATDQPAVLIAEDDRFDQIILRRAFKAARLGVSVRFVEHGEELLRYLRVDAGPPEPGSGTLPAVIFLDLNMPVVDGWAALRELRSEPRWTSIPVVVMSTLANEEDIARVYASGASAYFTKPTSFDDMVEAIRRSAAPWLTAPEAAGRDEPR